jgi:uncharacterized tellurite resistance protein B-like protein
MANPEVIKALAKVIIATAWADHQINNDEINSLKDLLFQLPDMTAKDWAELDIYLESPVDQAERARLVADLQNRLNSSADRSLAVDAIDKLVNADGQISPEEHAVVEEIKSAIQGANASGLGKMGRLLGGSINRRSQSLADAPNRERYLDDFVRNKIFYSLSRRLALDSTELDFSEEVIRKLSLAGGLMARVAYVDRDFKEGETGAMEEAIKNYLGVSDTEAALVAEISVSEIARGLDYYRLSREFFESTTEDERVRFLDVLFAVADGDEGVSYLETEEIRTISTVLKLTHRQFIDAKLKVPAERRTS